MEKQEKLLLIVNLHAGMMKIKAALPDIIDLYCRQNQDVTVYTTSGKGDATRICRERGMLFDTVVCCGGDGTLNEVLCGLLPLENLPMVGYIPAGTTNDFASSMKIPSNLLEAARRAVCGTPTPIDVGQFNSRYFSYVASFGAFTESSYATPQYVKNALGHLAYIIEGMKDLHTIHPYQMKITVENRTWEDEYLFGCVSNSTSIGGIVKLSESAVDMRDGKFEVMLIKSPKNAAETQKIILGILTHQFDGEVIKFFPTSEIAFYSKNQLPWTLDGEYEAGSTEIQIRNLHEAIQMRI